jgi:peptidoglycan/xylan/chitin deacetylase (PgdA/CDA1 family)
VQSGDTLSGIARRFSTTVAAILAVNDIPNPNAIRVGQRITLPGGAHAPATPPPTHSPAPTPAPATPPSHSGQGTVPAGGPIYSVHTGRKLIALTFDDGPNGAYTDAVLATLQRHHVHATFFVVGSNVAADPSRVRREAAAGHAIGNHSWNHPQLTDLDDAAVRSQLTRTSDAIQSAIGRRPDFFRAPYGARSTRVDDIARRTGMRDVLWDVDTVDWSRPGTKSIGDTAIHDAHSGSIILMHDGGGNRQQTVDALDRVITTLQSQGYQFVTVPELVANGN